MTQLEALDDLISAVKAGETSRVHIERMSAQADLAEAGSIYGSAYQDDLNAARMVCKAVSPEGEWHLTSSGTCIISGKVQSTVVGHQLGLTPGRALLLASLMDHRSTLVAS